MAENRLADSDGQRNRRLTSFSFGFLIGPSENRGDCAQNCARMGVPKTSARRTVQSPRVVALSVKGDGLNVVRRTRFCYGAVSYKCLRHVYLQGYGEVAEWPKAAVC
jgi:hypothetical protein